MIDPNVAYEIIKFWLPLVSGFLLVVKAYFSAKRNVGEYANKLLNNHLHSIQDATIATVAETKRTNDILAKSVDKTNYIAAAVDDHTEKETQVWSGILQTLAILEDRSRKSSNARRKR